MGKAKVEKSKFKKDRKPKVPAEEEGESISSLLKIIHADIRTMKSDLKENTSKINDVTSKISEIERNQEKLERENSWQFEGIKADMTHLEKSVTSKVVDLIDPKITELRSGMKDNLSSMRSELKEDMCSEMRKL